MKSLEALGDKKHSPWYDKDLAKRLQEQSVEEPAPAREQKDSACPAVLYLSTESKSKGNRIWKYDGTLELLVEDGGELIMNLTAHDGRLFFSTRSKAPMPYWNVKELNLDTNRARECGTFSHNIIK